MECSLVNGHRGGVAGGMETRHRVVPVPYLQIMVDEESGHPSS